MLHIAKEGILASSFSPHNPYDVLTHHHAYYILYPVAFLAKFTGALTALSFCMAASFTAIPLIAYVYIRKVTGSILTGTLATVVCVTHPLWQISSVGQFYVDRLFIPFSILFVLSLYHYLDKKEQNSAKTGVALYLAIFFGLIGGLTIERNMLIVGFVAGFYALVSGASWPKKLRLITFALFCLVYVASYMLFFNDNPDNSRVQESLIDLGNIIQAVSTPGVSHYLLFSGSLLLLPAIFVPRLFIAISPIVMINIIITVGGAEKTGWLTHYHSHYFGFF